MKLRTAFILPVLLFAVSAAEAKVTAQSSSGFTLECEVDVKVTHQNAYDNFVSIGSWWDMDHSYSHDGANMHVEAKPGGTWFETLPNGGYVTHLDVAQAAPGERLVFTGGLGPLAFMGVAGSMTVTFTKAQQGTHVKVTYAVGGFDPGRFRDLSKAVDEVIGGQLARFANFSNTGKP